MSYKLKPNREQMPIYKIDNEILKIYNLDKLMITTASQSDHSVNQAAYRFAGMMMHHHF